MPNVRFNLMTDALFGAAKLDRATGYFSLPELLAGLASGEVTEFVALQPHQTHAWHAFLVQLAAICIHACEGVIPQSADQWRAALRATTGSRDEPWCLIVDDLLLPAFMQPPVPGGSLRKWSNPTPCPDEIDVLVTSKNHDVKSQRIAAPRPEHWIYALVSLQTMSGYPGRKNYGIARMNGGYGNRPCIAVAPDSRPATRFVRDLALLLTQRSDVAERYGYNATGGYALLWLFPWDGNDQISLPDCDPWFIEVCRRIRLTVDQDSEIIARMIGTDKKRIQASEELKGNLGDAWTPVRIKDGAALTAKDLTYDSVQEILFGSDYRRSPASEPKPEDGQSPVFVAQVFARGQGQTEGLHERVIPVPPKARRLLLQPQGFERLGRLSRERVEIVGRAKNKVLKPALLALLQGGPDRIDFQDDPRVHSLLDSLDQRVDMIYFPRLFDDADRDPADARASWMKEVRDLAQEILRSAFDSVPIPSARRYRAISVAERVFNGSARKQFPDLYQTRTEEGEIDG